MESAFYAITTPKFQKDSCGYLCKSLKHVAKPSLICGILHSDRLVFTANLKDRSIIILLDGLFYTSCQNWRKLPDVSFTDT